MLSDQVRVTCVTSVTSAIRGPFFTILYRCTEHNGISSSGEDDFLGTSTSGILPERDAARWS